MARADLPAGDTLTWIDPSMQGLLINENNADPPVAASTPNALKRYFDYAHCLCSQANSGMQTSFQQRIVGVNPTSLSRPIDIWVGTQCDDPMTRVLQCRQIPGIGFASFNQIITPQSVTMPLVDLMTPVPVDGSGTCTNTIQGSDTMYAIIDADGDGTPDTYYPVTYNVDTQPPILPSNFSAQASDGGAVISFTPPGDVSDIAYYEAFCADLSGQPARTPDTCDTPDDTDANKVCQRYVRAQDLCDMADPDSLLQPQDIAVEVDPESDATTEQPTIAPPAMIAGDPSFLCGSSGTPTASSVTVSGLTNGTPYTIGLISVDLSGNYRGVYFTTTVTPQPVTDLWQDLHGRGSKVEGGYCLLESTYGDDSGITNTMRSFRDDTLAKSAFGRWLTAQYYKTLGKLGPAVHGVWPLRILFGIALAPLVVLALLWHYLTLPGLLGLVAFLWLARRYRFARWKLAAATVTLLAIIAAPGRARADDVEPYWKTESIADDETSSLAGIPVVKWHAGVRLGPYTPAIDKQAGGPAPGPFASMFGSGASVMPMLDVDRVLWDGFGQVGVGISLGFMSKKAHPYEKGMSSLDPDPVRSEGNTTTFRLFPVSVTAVYRFTYLDDEYGIPIIPYVRGGLGYYIWYMKTNDHLSYVCKDGSDISMNPDCEKDPAHGASLGVVGSIGIAVRAERIDKEAAKSMQQSGLEHAGFYGELSIGKVDGFGSQTKLSVGDTTWFAGVDFEF